VECFKNWYVLLLGYLDSIWVKENVVDWWALVWFLFSIPKQAFITWLAMRDALTTGRKLLIWGFQGDVKCIFCRHVIKEKIVYFLLVLIVVEFDSRL
jgi:hypothetical protein